MLLAAVPALSGHAASVGRLNGIAILSDTLHVLGAGVWMGTLAALLAVGIPAAIIAADGAGGAVAAMVRAFSPMALAGAAVVAVTGILNVVFQLGAISDVWSTGYGRALLIKLALLAGVARWASTTGAACSPPWAMMPARTACAAPPARSWGWACWCCW